MKILYTRFLALAFLISLSSFCLGQTTFALRISGSLVDTSGAPVPNQRVKCYMDQNNFFGFGFTAHGATNSSGSYTVTVDLPLFVGNGDVDVSVVGCNGYHHVDSISFDTFTGDTTFTNVDGQFCPTNISAYYTTSNVPGTLVVTYMDSSVSDTAMESSIWYEPPGFIAASGDTTTLTYPTSGTYILEMRKSNVAGRSSSYTDSITLTLSPTTCHAYFTSMPDTTGQFTLLIDAGYASAPNPQYLWHFGDGDSATVPYPIHTYPGTGLYTLCLTISDSLNPGCSATYCKDIYISQKTNTPFTIKVISPLTGVDPVALPRNTVDFWPQPAQDRLNMQLTLLNESDIVIDWYDLNGKHIYTHQLGLQNSGTSRHLLDTEQFANGLYLLRIRTEEEDLFQKILVD